MPTNLESLVSDIWQRSTTDVKSPTWPAGQPACLQQTGTYKTWSNASSTDNWMLLLLQRLHEVNLTSGGAIWTWRRTTYNYDKWYQTIFHQTACRVNGLLRAVTHVDSRELRGVWDAAATSSPGLQGSPLPGRSARVTKSLSTSHRRCDSEAARESERWGESWASLLRLDFFWLTKICYKSCVLAFSPQFAPPVYW